MPNYSGVWTLSQQFQARGQNIWPAPPGAPTSVSATGGNASASVAFTAPANTGIPAGITGYRVTSSPGAITATGASSPISITGLTNGTSYTFTVAAQNTAGYGPESSPSNSVTPALPSSYIGAFTVTNSTSGQTYIAYDSVNKNTLVVNGRFSTLGEIMTLINSSYSRVYSSYATRTGCTGLTALYVLNPVFDATATNFYAGIYPGSIPGYAKYTNTNPPTLSSFVWLSAINYSGGYDTGGWGHVSVDTSSNVYLSGSLGRTVYFGPCCCFSQTYLYPSLVKMNSNGTVGWVRASWSSSLTNGFFRSSTVSSSGSIYAFGATGSGPGYVAKFTSAGGLTWDARYDENSGNSQVYHAGVEDGSGAVYMTGSISQPNGNAISIVKLTSSGSVTWSRKWVSPYSGTNNWNGVSIQIGADGYIYVLGNGVDTTLGQYNALVLLKIDSSGNLQWQRTLKASYQTLFNNNTNNMFVDADGNINFSWTNYTASNQSCIMRVPPDGTKTGSYTVSGNTYTYATISGTFSGYTNTPAFLSTGYGAGGVGSITNGTYSMTNSSTNITTVTL